MPCVSCCACAVLQLEKQFQGYPAAVHHKNFCRLAEADGKQWHCSVCSTVLMSLGASTIYLDIYPSIYLSTILASFLI